MRDTSRRATGEESVVDFFFQNGYVIGHVDNEEIIDQVNFEVDELIREGNYRTNSGIYAYNESPRIVEAWRYSSSVHQIVFDSSVTTLLHKLFTARPIPFSTINFIKSTEQPIHSDYVHFGTVPHFRLAAVWVALEDIDLASGPLQVVPGSHRDPMFCYSELGFGPAKSLGEVKKMYTAYEMKVANSLREARGRRTAVIPLLRKGDFLLWDANLLHGSPRCLDRTLSRRSQVTHYHFEGTELFYNPAFSQPERGLFVKRQVTEIPVP